MTKKDAIVCDSIGALVSAGGAAWSVVANDLWGALVLGFLGGTHSGVLLVDLGFIRPAAPDREPLA